MEVDQPIRTHRFENAEEAAAVVPGAHVRYLPLARPKADWRMVDMSLGDSRLLCGRMGADTSIAGTLDRNLLYFLAPLSGKGWTVQGKQIGSRSLGVQGHTTDIESWIGHSMHSTSLQVRTEKFERVYSRFAASDMPTWGGVRMFTLSATATSRLRSSIATTLRIATEWPEAFAKTGMGGIVEDLILERLMQAVCTASRAERPEYRALTSRCNDYLAANRDRCVTPSELRETLEVGDRTLRRFFASAYGTSPARLLRTQRLHAVNRALAEPRTGVTVTTAAMSLGFFDVGRFASSYRRLFGERPSATLRRARATGFPE